MVIKVLIVDDEINVCKLINNLIDWKSYNLEVCGIAHTGRDALAQIKTLNPNIVITDIHMPDMNGLELLKEARALTKEIKFIIISGYKYFEYAYTAIKYGVEHFLLKPIDKDELLDALQRCSCLIDDYCIQQTNLELENQLHEKNLMLREEFFKNILHNDLCYDTLECSVINKSYNLNFQEGYFQMGLIHFEVDPKLSIFINKLISKLKTCIEQNLKSYCYDLIFYPYKNDLLFILNLNTPLQLNHSFNNIFSEIENSKKATSFINITMCLSPSIQSIKQLGLAYSNLQLALYSKPILGTNKILTIKNLNASLNEFDSSILSHTIKSLDTSIETLNTQELNLLCSTLFEEMKPILKSAPYFIFPFVDVFMSLIKDTINRIYKLYNITPMDSCKIRDGLLHCNSLDECISYVQNLIIDLLNTLKQELDQYDSKVINIVKAYIKEHYHEHIELADVAQKVYLNPAYLGILFKQKTNQNFITYLTNVRIEAAKSHLKDIRYNISEISNMVGYKDTRYFSKIFKKEVGVKPTEYRKIYRP